MTEDGSRGHEVKLRRRLAHDQPSPIYMHRPGQLALLHLHFGYFGLPAMSSLQLSLLSLFCSAHNHELVYD
jgi:hypothetical protein